MIDVEKTPDSEPDSGGGGIMHPERLESGLLATREARLLGRAIRKNWYKGQRWPTEITKTELTSIASERELTLKEQATLETFDGLSNPRSSHIHIRNVIAMEGQNIDTEKADQGLPAASPVQVNVGVSVRQGMIDDPEYLEFLRGRAVESNGHPSPVCANGERGGLENGSPPGTPRPGTNGFGSGTH
jgi:hypothetical protein